MAARDHLEDFWEEVQMECVRRGIEVGSPKRGTEMSVRAATGVAWTIHHRSDHLRPGIILRPTNRSNPKELVRRLAPAVERVEERVSRQMVVEQKDTTSRKARIYLRVDSFDGEDFTSWPGSISQTVEEWQIVMDEFRPYLNK